MTHNPMITEWELYFNRADGYDNRATVAKAFANFWKELEVDKLEISGKCRLGGRVFGREGFNDGDEILTSNVRFIERVERGDCGGVQHDLMCATTASGNKYFFYSNDYNVYMFLMLGDLLRTGELNSYRNYYLKRELRGSKLI
ncbi:hypothetical protein IKG12_01310 [Candidatus Saccharibacteria bacterium]|nr:hypothetical protein [Candidatus Saccharibacteria bacterium]